MAGGPGIEPGQPDPESGVLPLDDPPTVFSLVKDFLIESREIYESQLPGDAEEDEARFRLLNAFLKASENAFFAEQFHNFIDSRADRSAR